MDAPRATEEQLLRIHSRDHVERIRLACEGSRPIDIDTPVAPGSWDAALRAAGGAVALVEALLAGTAPTGFAALRPPGHHAEPDRAMGFCLFSNAAVAAQHAIAELGAERVAIVDWDVHHGNGTQAAFYESADVLFVSLHRWPFYPGTGAQCDAGRGGGEGTTINLPMAAGSGEREWLAALDLALPTLREFEPSVILISAGYDAHHDDPIGGCMLGAESFGALAERLRGAADDLGVPVGAVLEGGYDLDALAASVLATMSALAPGS